MTEETYPTYAVSKRSNAFKARRAVDGVFGAKNWGYGRVVTYPMGGLQGWAPSKYFGDYRLSHPLHSPCFTEVFEQLVRAGFFHDFTRLGDLYSLTRRSRSLQSRSSQDDCLPGVIGNYVPVHELGGFTPMKLNLRVVLTAFAICASLGLSAANAETAIKLSLSSTPSDLAMNASGVLGTTSDGDASTTGDQNTAIDYTAFLDPLFADITTSTASFSIGGLQRTGTPSIVGGTIIVQDFFGGSFNLYSPTNSLLLSGNLQDSTLTGVIGSTGTGSIFTTKVGAFTNGSLLPYVDKNSLNLSIALSNVNGGSGFVVSGSPSALQPFSTDASVNIVADKGLGIPEPASIAIALLSVLGLGLIRPRRS